MKFVATTILSLAFLLSLTNGAMAQELNCTVQINTQQIQGTDKQVFKTLETAIYEFMNNRKWTNDQFLNQERIECSMIINVTEWITPDVFKATVQIQSRRPIYKTSYNSTVLTFNDMDVNFKYIEFQPLEFNETSHINNLTSILAFYAYIVIGLDYDTYSRLGGTPYFQKAQTVVNNAQGDQEFKGWKFNESTKNRYWLVENLMNESFKPLREALYVYHRNGLDIMSEKKEEGRKPIMESMEMVKTVYANKPGSFLLQVFFSAKADELVNIFSQAYPEEKNKATTLLNEIDPSNSTKYQDILKSK